MRSASDWAEKWREVVTVDDEEDFDVLMNDFEEAQAEARAEGRRELAAKLREDSPRARRLRCSTAPDARLPSAPLARDGGGKPEAPIEDSPNFKPKGLDELEQRGFRRVNRDGGGKEGT